jgi:flagellar protein FlbD
MVELQRLTGAPIVVNAAYILTVEETPDTVIGLSTGEKLMVKNSAEEVVQKVTDFLRSLGRGPILVPLPAHLPRDQEP